MTDIIRDGVTYRQLPNGTITCGPLDQSGMLGGTGEQDRNQEHNPTRLHRIKQFHPNPKVLDFGCGTGIFMDYLQMNGVVAVGYDKYGMARGTVSEFPEDLFDVVTMIEVIEHTAAPYSELDAIFKALKSGGILMVETSFTDWMDLQTDVYVNPRIGHSTIFSHEGLDELMKEKGFEVYGHINRNVRVYQKPGAEVFQPKISLVTMGQANPIALKKTIESFKGIVDEIVFGDLLIFDQDREVISHYTREYNFRMVKLPFDYIFQNGFAATLNQLAEHAHNDWILYMNVSEVMDGEHPIKAQMSEDYNCYSFDHATDPHRWFRLYNKKEIKWGGLIHEEVVGDLRRCPFNVFRMADTEKDLDDPFKAKVANDVKELCYWAQFQKLVEQPELRANTHPTWIQHAEEAYQSHMDRMAAKGKRWQAFKEGNLSMYLEDIYSNPEFEKERFESSTLINFQGDRKLL
jgi:SAM-dependent methyltransferase